MNAPSSIQHLQQPHRYGANQFAESSRYHPVTLAALWKFVSFVAITPNANLRSRSGRICSPASAHHRNTLHALPRCSHWNCRPAFSQASGSISPSRISAQPRARQTPASVHALIDHRSATIHRAIASFRPSPRHHSLSIPPASSHWASTLQPMTSPESTSDSGQRFRDLADQHQATEPKSWTALNALRGDIEKLRQKGVSFAGIKLLLGQAGVAISENSVRRFCRRVLKEAPKRKRPVRKRLSVGTPSVSSGEGSPPAPTKPPEHPTDSSSAAGGIAQMLQERRKHFIPGLPRRFGPRIANIKPANPTFHETTEPHP